MSKVLVLLIFMFLSLESFAGNVIRCEPQANNPLGANELVMIVDLESPDMVVFTEDAVEIAECESINETSIKCTGEEAPFAGENTLTFDPATNVLTGSGNLGAFDCQD